jgi:hypothetical protein
MWATCFDKVIIEVFRARIVTPAAGFGQLLLGVLSLSRRFLILERKSDKNMGTRCTKKAYQCLCDTSEAKMHSPLQ